MKITPVKKSTIVEKIVDQVLEQIVDESLRPGMKLPSENDLATNLGVGRSSVREALRVLEALELVEKSKDGPVIRSPGSEFIARWLGINIAVKQIPFTELLEVREVVEVALAGFAAQKIDEGNVKILKELIQKMEYFAEINNAEEYISANVDFHVTIAAAANNSLLYQVVESVRQALSNFQRRVYQSPEVHIQSLSQHQEILDALKSRNPDMARQAMSKHLTFMRQLYTSSL